jgi:hypothetical protein
MIRLVQRHGSELEAGQTPTIHLASALGAPSASLQVWVTPGGWQTGPPGRSLCSKAEVIPTDV